MSADLARRVHDLVREPRARQLFRNRTNDYINWRVRNADEAWAHLVGLGGTPRHAVHEVGGGIRVAVVADPFGNSVGVIEIPGEGGAKSGGGGVGTSRGCRVIRAVMPADARPGAGFAHRSGQRQKTLVAKRTRRRRLTRA